MFFGSFKSQPQDFDISTCCPLEERSRRRPASEQHILGDIYSAMSSQLDQEILLLVRHIGGLKDQSIDEAFSGSRIDRLRILLHINWWTTDKRTDLYPTTQQWTRWLSERPTNWLTEILYEIILACTSHIAAISSLVVVAVVFVIFVVVLLLFLVSPFFCWLCG